MDRSVLISILKSSAHLPEDRAEYIAEQFQFKKLSRGEKFIKAARVANEYLFLQTGIIRSFLLDLEGNEITMNFYVAGEMVFEVASFFQRQPSQETFEAVTECAGWVLNYETLNELFHALPEFREFGRAMLVKGFITFKQRTLSLINKTAEERYELLLQSKPEIFQHASLKYIASYLGVTDTSLSRIRKSFSTK
jgi:CRP-like cAMP-binding protein